MYTIRWVIGFSSPLSMQLAEAIAAALSPETSALLAHVPQYTVYFKIRTGLEEKKTNRNRSIR